MAAKPWPPSQRQQNRAVILRKIVLNGHMSRRALALETGLTEASVSRITRELIQLGLLRDGEEYAHDGKPGRREIEVRLKTNGAFVVGVCLSAFARRVSIVNAEGKRVVSAEIPETDMADPLRALGTVTRTVRRMLKSAKLDSKRLFGVGTLIAGSVDYESGVLVHAPLLGWKDVDVAHILQRQLAVTVKVENVANAIAIAHGRRYKLGYPSRLLLVHVAIGMGASLLINGELVRAHGDEAAISHIPISAGTKQCVCGMRGCLATIATGRAIVESLPESLRTRIVAPTGTVGAAALENAIREANIGDPVIASTFEHAGYELGRTLVALTLALFPDTIVLAGPVSRAQPFIMGAKAGYESNLSPAVRHRCEIVVSDIDYITAAEVFGLEELVFSPRLDVSRLPRPWIEI